MSREETIHAYRHLLRAALQAVCHSQPASTLARNQLRQAFRAGSNAPLDPRAVKRTVWFLRNAARTSGVEHRIVRNLLFTGYWKDNTEKQLRPSWKAIVERRASKKDDPVRDMAYVHYGKTIDMLNKTMGLCLPLP